MRLYGKQTTEKAEVKCYLSALFEVRKGCLPMSPSWRCKGLPPGAQLAVIRERLGGGGSRAATYRAAPGPPARDPDEGSGRERKMPGLQVWETLTHPAAATRARGARPFCPGEAAARSSALMRCGSAFSSADRQQQPAIVRAAPDRPRSLERPDAPPADPRRHRSLEGKDQGRLEFRSKRPGPPASNPLEGNLWGRGGSGALGTLKCTADPDSPGPRRGRWKASRGRGCCRPRKPARPLAQELDSLGAQTAREKLGRRRERDLDSGMSQAGGWQGVGWRQRSQLASPAKF